MTTEVKIIRIEADHVVVKVQGDERLTNLAEGDVLIVPNRVVSDA